jgi:hypothetical protein
LSRGLSIVLEPCNSAQSQHYGQWIVTAPPTYQSIPFGHEAASARASSLSDRQLLGLPARLSITGPLAHWTASQRTTGALAISVLSSPSAWGHSSPGFHHPAKQNTIDPSVQLRHHQIRCLFLPSKSQPALLLTRTTSLLFSFLFFFFC